MGWDDASVGNGYIYQCGTDSSPRFDIFSFTLGNQTDKWLSVDSKDYIDQTIEFNSKSRQKSRDGKGLNNLLIVSPSVGGLERVIQIKYKIIHIYLYLNLKDYSEKRAKKTFSFYNPNLIGKPSPINLYGIPLPSSLFTFEYESARDF